MPAPAIGKHTMITGQKPTVEERLDIQELFAQYCWSLNTGDAEWYIGLFNEGGWVDHKPQGRCTTREEKLNLLNQVWYSSPYAYLGRMHLPNNFIMRREGDGVRVKAYWTITRLEQAFNNFHLFIAGDWNALCVQADGEWKFAELTATHWFRETAPWVGDPKVRMEKGKWG